MSVNTNPNDASVDLFVTISDAIDEHGLIAILKQVAHHLKMVSERDSPYCRTCQSENEFMVRELRQLAERYEHLQVILESSGGSGRTNQTTNQTN